MKNFILKSVIFSFILSLFLIGTYFAIQARQTNNPGLIEPAPTGGLYTNVGQTLSAAKRNALTDKVNKDYPQESLAAGQAGTEQDTGTKRIDGKTIYRKVINIGTMSNVGATFTDLTVNHNISNLDRFLKFEGMIYPTDLNSANQWLMGQYYTNYSTVIIGNKTTLTLKYIGSWSGRTAYAIAYYTKS